MGTNAWWRKGGDAGAKWGQRLKTSGGMTMREEAPLGMMIPYLEWG